MLQLERTVTINRPRDEVYECWRDFDNLPRLFEPIEDVTFVSPGRTHWTLRGPGGESLQWDAEIIADRPGDLLAWRSLEGADLSNEGRVEFRDAPAGRGTELRVVVAYEPPGGLRGTAVAAAMGDDLLSHLRELLQRFKQVAETRQCEPVRADP